jgi:hypothetical protein
MLTPSLPPSGGAHFSGLRQLDYMHEGYLDESEKEKGTDGVLIYGDPPSACNRLRSKDLRK